MGCTMYVRLFYLGRVQSRRYTRITGIGEAEWAFKTDITVTDEELASPATDLLFDGLDTFATVLLVSSCDVLPSKCISD